jgi:hypothetical protein
VDLTMRLNPSIDEMARDARTLVGIAPGSSPTLADSRAWAAKFRSMLACYGWRVERQGPVYFVGKHVVLEDWEIVRSAPSS